MENGSPVAVDPATDRDDGRSKIALLRPEAIRLDDAPAQAVAGQNRLTGRVVGGMYLGPHVEYIVEVGTDRLRAYSRSALAPGSPAILSFDARDCRLVDDVAQTEARLQPCWIRHLSLQRRPSRRVGWPSLPPGLTFEDIPAPVLHRAKLLILDALGCGLASNAYDFADAALAGATALGGEGTCSVIGRDVRLPVRDAALVNGMLIHGLDFDDTHLASIIHATAACLPMRAHLRRIPAASTAATLLVAYAAGMETAIRVGAAAKGGFHHAGFHATGLVAHFSSAVVAARMLGLSADGIVAAQGIAASTASGVQVFLEEGAWTKRMHPGWAAVAGITAAVLAAERLQGPDPPL